MHHVRFLLKQYVGLKSTVCLKVVGWAVIRGGAYNIAAILQVMNAVIYVSSTVLYRADDNHETTKLSIACIYMRFTLLT